MIDAVSPLSIGDDSSVSPASSVLSTPQKPAAAGSTQNLTTTSSTSSASSPGGSQGSSANDSGYGTVPETTPPTQTQTQPGPPPPVPHCTLPTMPPTLATASGYTTVPPLKSDYQTAAEQQYPQVVLPPYDHTGMYIQPILATNGAGGKCMEYYTTAPPPPHAVISPQQAALPPPPEYNPCKQDYSNTDYTQQTTITDHQLPPGYFYAVPPPPPPHLTNNGYYTNANNTEINTTTNSPEWIAAAASLQQQRQQPSLPPLQLSQQQQQQQQQQTAACVVGDYSPVTMMCSIYIEPGYTSNPAAAAAASAGPTPQQQTHNPTQNTEQQTQGKFSNYFLKLFSYSSLFTQSHLSHPQGSSCYFFLVMELNSYTMHHSTCENLTRTTCETM